MPAPGVIILDSSVEHKVCVRATGASTRKERVEEEKATVDKMKEGASKAVTKPLGPLAGRGHGLPFLPNGLMGQPC